MMSASYCIKNLHRYETEVMNLSDRQGTRAYDRALENYLFWQMEYLQARKGTNIALTCDRVAHDFAAAAIALKG